MWSLGHPFSGTLRRWLCRPSEFRRQTFHIDYCGWARISVLVWSGITVSLSAPGILRFIFIPIANAPADASIIVRLVVLVFYALPLAIGKWWLILFNRKEVAAQFLVPVLVKGTLASTGQGMTKP
jgi:hypothetical protein